MNIQVNDRVIATFPNSALSCGGIVLTVIQVPGKPVAYDVCFLGGSHHIFSSENVVKVS